MKKVPLKVFFLILGNAPIGYYRMVSFANQMMNMDDIYPFYPKFDPHRMTLPEYELDIDTHLKELEHAISMADVVVCQVVHSTKFGCLIPVMKEEYPHIPWIVETDDHPFAVEASNVAFDMAGQGSEMEQNAYDQIADSDGCVVSTDYLKSYFMDKGKPIHVAPNSIDFDLWGKVKKAENRRITIGWSGAASHLKDLSIVKEALLEILDSRPEVEVKCLHGAIDFIEHPRFSNENKWTDIYNYPSKLASHGYDIGIAPLWDSEFNRAKSNVRFLEYSALNIPTVASNCGPYKDTITDGETGFLASTKKEWVDKLNFLLDNASERSRIGDNAYNLVKQNYNLSIVSRRYADFLKEFVKDFREKEHTDVYVSGITK